MTEPTDAEIVELMRDGYNCRYNDEADHVDFARAVLAKWGQPAHSGEPVGYLYCGGSYGDELAEWEIVADQLQCDRLNEHHWSLGKEAKLPIYTAHQPTQAQAGAVPLALHQRDSIKANAWRETPLHGYFDADEIIDAIEAAHGIK